MKRLTYILWIPLLISCVSKDRLAPYAKELEIKEPIPLSETIKTLNGIAFSKDGSSLFISKQIDRTFDNGRYYASIFKSEFKNGNYSEPTEFELGLDIDAYHPVLSVNNEYLFFNSRSHLDSGNTSIKHNIWVIEFTGESWSKPRMVEGVNSEGYDSYPTIAANNNMYFNSNRTGGLGGMDIYVSKFVNGEYKKPENIVALNSADEENDLVIDPHERFIIFNRYFHSTQSLDLFIAFKKDDGWTTPRLLDNINTTEGWELTPSLSPDGKYFFYELNSLIMQIDLAHLIYPEELSGFGKREF